MMSVPSLRPTATRLACTAFVLSLAGCSTIDSFLSTDKVDYKAASRQTQGLDIPPDLTQLAKDNRAQVQGGSITASALSAVKPANSTNAQSLVAGSVATNAAGDVRLERSGTDRWLHTSATPEQLWPQIRNFWQERGLEVVKEMPEVGTMETNWGENRAKLPQDFVRSTIGKVFDGLYSTGERDMYRTRVERSGTGTDIFISHRGMQEVYADNNKDRTVWQPRASDPELEIEFLRRLMLKLGGQPNVTAAAPQTPAPASQSPATATAVSTVDGQPTIVLTDDQERAWRRVGVALDRSGFTVEDRDRRQGLYFVRYVASTTPGKEPGWLSRLFGGDSKAPELARYRVVVASAPQGSQIKVLNAQGQAEKSANAEKILKLLAAELR